MRDEPDGNAEEGEGRLTVLLVDDHPVVRDGIRYMLRLDSQVEVIGVASDGEEAITKTNDLNPDVILMDIRMPRMSGIEATQKIKEAHPNVAIIVLTMYDSELHVIEALRAGAAGYLVKDSPPELLCHAIHAVRSGGTMVKSGLLRRAVQRTLPGINDGRGPMVETLTAREMEVLRLIAKGCDNRGISQELILAEVTVKKYVQNVMAKLGVSDRTNAAISAMRMGLVE